MTTLKEAQEKVRKLALDAYEITKRTDLSQLEMKNQLDVADAEIKHWTEEVASLSFVDEKRKQYESALGGQLGDLGGDTGGDGGDGKIAGYKSLGRQFVEANEYTELVKRGLKGGNFGTGEIELKTTLTEGTVGSPGGGYQISNQPNVLPGITQILFTPLVVADLLPQGTTSSPLIRYLVESAVTNAAAATAEGGTKPESALTFTKVDEVLHKIATFLPVSDEMLEDFEQIQSYIDARLALFVQLAEQAELLTGDGTGSHLVGLLNRSGLSYTIPKGGAAAAAPVPLIPASDNDMDAIYRQITNIRLTSFLEPDGIVIEPTAWQNIILSKTSQGVYYANGPFVGQQPETLWGKRVVMTPAMPAGDALVGAFRQAAQIFRKGGLTVAASNSHNDFFQKNLTAIRAEERLGLAVYRPSAFGIVTGL